MQIRLDLRRHCIATETKKRYNKALSAYLRQSGDPARLEAEIECLKEALETLDFPGLRTRYPELAGHNDAEVLLSRTEDKGLGLSLGGRPLDLMLVLSEDTKT